MKVYKQLVRSKRELLMELGLVTWRTRPEATRLHHQIILRQQLLPVIQLMQILQTIITTNLFIVRVS